MRTSMAMGYTHGLKAFLKVLLCVVLVVSLCPPMTGAFADEPDGVEQTPATEQANADGQEGASAEATGDAEMGIASDAGESSANGEDAERTESVPRADEPKEAGDAESESAAATDESESASAEEESEEMVLSAEADGVRAVVTVAAGVELPEGAHVVVTPLLKAKAQEGATDGEAADEAAGATEEAVADEEAASDEAAEGAEEDAVEASSEDSEETTGDAADEAVAEDAEQAAAEEGASERITGAEVVVNGMSDAVTTYLKKKDADAQADFTVADAYAVEVLDEQGGIVPLGKDQAKLALTVQPEENAETPDGVYAVDRQGAAEDATEQETAAAEKPVSDVAEEEYTDEQQASETITYDGEATELADDAVKTDEESGETTVEVDGVQDVVMVQDAKPMALGATKPGGPLKAPTTTPSGTIMPASNMIDNSKYGITMNLFDYVAEDSNQNNYDNPKTGGTSINSGRNNKETQLQFYGHGTIGKNGNRGINNFAAPSGTNSYSVQYAMQGIVAKELDETDGTGFPTLNTSSGDSLGYLFDPDTPHSAKTTYKNVNGLFYEQDGMMTYSSNDYYAHYNSGTNRFDVYTDTYYRYSGSGQNVDQMPIGFFPFDAYNSGPSVPGACVNPTETTRWNANNHVNHHLGLTMTVPITMPYKGQFKDENGTLTDMQFRFSGDDDMWVFVDGVLVLDVGGIHQPVEGTINFHTGEVELKSGYGGVYQADGYALTATGLSDSSVALGTKSNIWQNEASAGQKYSFAGDQWRAGTEHIIQVFYLERGGCDSNLELSTNLHRAAKQNAQITKEWANEVEEAEKTAAGAKAQLVRKAVAREAAGVAPREAGSPNEFYSVVDTKDLPIEGTNWTARWSDLDNGGYPLDAYPNTYYDYTYYVREVPLFGYDQTYDKATVDLSGTEVDGLDGTYVNIVNSPAVVTNTPQKTQVSVEKIWDPRDQAPTSGGIWVRLTGKQGSDVVSTNDFELNSGNSWSHTFNNLKVAEGLVYTVEEGTKSGDTFTPATEFQIGGTNYRQASIVYKDKDGHVIQDGTTLSGEVQPNAGSVEITNSPVRSKLKLLKVDKADHATTIENAVFVLQNSSNEYRTATGWSSQGSEAQRFTTDENGFVEVGELEPGAYTITEKDVPDAYMLLSGPITITVAEDGAITENSEYAEFEEGSFDESTNTYTLTVENTLTYLLPATNGPGVFSFLFVGAFLMALAFGISRQRRNALAAGSALTVNSLLRR